MAIIIFLMTGAIATFIILLHEVVSYYLFSGKREEKPNKLMEKLKILFSPKRCSIAFKVLAVICFMLVPAGIYELTNFNVFPAEIISFAILCVIFGISFLKASKEFQETESLFSDIG